jgi:hypothetical protein
MTLNAEFAYQALWFAHPVLQAGVAAMMLRRKLHRAFPAFFTYVVFQILVFALTFPFREERFYTIFYYLYWATNAVSVVLGFRVIHEIFLDVFRPYHTLRDLGSVLFKWAGLVMLMVAGVVAASAHGGADSWPLPTAILTLERSVRVAQCGLILFLLVFSRYLGTNWQQRSFGIALGFGFFAWVELALVALQKYFHDSTVSVVNMTVYNLTILIWLGYVFLKSPAREQAAPMLRPQRWEQSLSDLQNPVPADSLIPMFESMVDRALSKTRPEPAPARAEGVAVGETSPRLARFSYPATPYSVGSKT